MILESGEDPSDWVQKYAQKYREEILPAILAEDSDIFTNMEAAEKKIKERLYH